MLYLNGVLITPTIFPDKTSQVWHIPDFANLSSDNLLKWEFESEAELIHVAQLKALIDSAGKNVELYIPYLPYARQDKEISNDATFALAPFLLLLKSLNFEYYTSFDIHNPSAVQAFIPDFININPTQEIKNAISDFEPDVIVYPDKGAHIRYSRLVSFPRIVTAEKVRDPGSGRIITFKLSLDTTNLKVLMVDDLCDGGATFINLSNLMHPTCTRGLYVSHGIFSKGLDSLKLAGISKFYTRLGVVRD